MDADASCVCKPPQAAAEEARGEGLCLVIAQTSVQLLQFCNSPLFSTVAPFHASDSTYKPSIREATQHARCFFIHSSSLGRRVAPLDASQEALGLLVHRESSTRTVSDRHMTHCPVRTEVSTRLVNKDRDRDGKRVFDRQSDARNLGSTGRR